MRRWNFNNEKSVDELHSETHVYRLLDELDGLLRGRGGVKKDDVNFQILLPAICWHDVWKSRRLPKGSLFAFVFDQWWDGMGSYFVFWRQVSRKRPHLPLFTLRKIARCIRQHAGISRKLFGIKTIEAQIVNDCDQLDGWSVKRLSYAAKKYLNNDYVNRTTYAIVKHYFKNKMMKDTARTFYFAWSRREYKRRRKPVVAYIRDVLKEMDEMIEDNS